MRDTKKIHQLDNVVPMESQSQRMVSSRLSQLPAPVSMVHGRSKQILLEHLRKFFDQADDSLFTMADRAESNQEQNIFFDSMREVRVQRRSVELNFSESLDLAFSALASADIPQLNSEVFENMKTDTLSLVHDDDLEEMVAVDSAAARSNHLCGEIIQYISLRLDSLVPVKVYQKNNPISPDSICSAFMEEVKRLDISIKAKLVLFRLFDKTVVSALPNLYEAINNLLIEQNVLPSLNMSDRNNPNRRSGGKTPNSSLVSESGFGVNSGHVGNPSYQQNPQAHGYNSHGHQPQGHAYQNNSGDLSPQVVDTLNNLFGNQGGNQGNSPGNNQQSVQNENVSGDMNAVATGDLLYLLTRIQQQSIHQDYDHASGVGGASNGINGPVNLRTLIKNAQLNNGVSGDIGRLDDEVMNLVNMLFEFILEDRNLASTMKALISRMQIPILKVAIADKTFFTKGGHIARRLLNEMATAAIGWSDSASPENGKNTDQTLDGSDRLPKDPLYKKMDHIVRTLLDDFDTDVSIFSELFADFTAFREKEKKRVAVLERRTLDAEDGKAKAEATRKKIASIIESRTEQVVLPEVVTTLINQAWSNVLFVTALKHGFESEIWTKTLRTMDELIWSSQAPESDKQRQALIRLVPTLLKKLRAGLDVISFNPFEMSKLFKALEEVHLACIRGRRADQVRKEPRDASAAELSLNKKPNVRAGEAKTSSKGDVSALDKSVKDEPKNTTQSEKEVADNSTSTIDNSHRPTDTSVSNDVTTQEIESKPEAVVVEEDPYLQQVESFNPGSWFELKEENGEAVRCRLAALIKATGRFIFVNRNGMKVADKSKSDLALALKNETLTMLDSGMLFDRALENVVSSLRKK